MKEQDAAHSFENNEQLQIIIDLFSKRHTDVKFLISKLCGYFNLEPHDIFDEPDFKGMYKSRLELYNKQTSELKTQSPEDDKIDGINTNADLYAKQWGDQFMPAKCGYVAGAESKDSELTRLRSELQQEREKAEQAVKIMQMINGLVDAHDLGQYIPQGNIDSFIKKAKLIN